jgi:hypothetical protein
MECGISKRFTFKPASSQAVYSKFHFFMPSVFDGLAVLQQRTAVGLPTATRITFALCYRLVFFYLIMITIFNIDFLFDDNLY